MKKSFFFWLIILSYTANGQIIEKYFFEPRDLNLADTNLISPLDKKASFWIERTILDDNIFIDSYLLCKAPLSKCQIKYKKLPNGNWDIFFDDKWFLLFNSKISEIQKSQILSDSTFIIPIITEFSLLDKNIYGFIIKNLSKYEPENNNIFLFNPNFGIIGIITPRTNLIRSDFIIKR